jgi:hypothetical protein
MTELNKISGAEYAVKKIFSNDFDFVIPSYQRPYAWTTEEAGELFDDLLEFMESQSEDEAYFLGSIVLIKKDQEPYAEVIDGQQRLTTLTILLAVIAARLEGSMKENFELYINEPGKPAEDIEPKPRLRLRERDQEFFYLYIQQFQFNELLQHDPVSLTDSQKNIRNNTEFFIEKIGKDLEDDKRKIEAFGKFIINRCFLVAVSTPSMSSAYRIFSVLNDRGLDLMPSDLLKSEIIGHIPETKHEQYTEKWEDWEDQLGRENFNTLFSHIRMLFFKSKARRTMLDEMLAFLKISNIDGKDFIDKYLIPYAGAFQIISNASYESSGDATVTNNYLKWLNQIDNSDWVPPAILYLTKYKNQPDKVERFFEQLERLAACMFLCRRDVNKRIERYSQLISAIEENKDVFGPHSPLSLRAEEKKEVQAVFAGDVYLMTKRPRTYLLLRLDSFMSDQAAVYDHKIITVEHVLPQTVEIGSYWSKKWPHSATRDKWLHKLGNLLLLSKSKNSQAQNYDFQTKKTKYFITRGGVSTFAITSKVLEYDDWTPDVVRKRQEELINLLIKGWKLG